MTEWVGREDQSNNLRHPGESREPWGLPIPGMAIDCTRVDRQQSHMPQRKQPCVYILASRPRGTLYVGTTSDIARRAWEHREGLTPGFTQRYGVKRLVWCEFYPTMIEAITGEKQIKEWRRAWKIELILTLNPDWNDLWDTLLA